MLSGPGLFPGQNVQVTSYTWNPGDRNSRSECDLVVSPSDRDNLIAASKRFYDYVHYRFTIATAYSIDGGYTWNQSSDLHLLSGDESAGGYTDPALAMDPSGVAYLVAEPDTWTSQPDPNDVISDGMTVFTSTDQGSTWSSFPRILAQRDAGDDKQWATADNSPSSPFYGNVYAVWAADTPLFFARKRAGQKSWIGLGADTSPTAIVDFAFAPAVCVSASGRIHLAWHNPGSSSVQYMTSTDGGESFSDPIDCVDGITDISSAFPLKPGADFPEFPHATFRVLTLVTIAPIGDDGCMVAWADARGAFTRIYYRTRDNTGTWSGDDSGTPLLGAIGFADSQPFQHFHPQLAVNASGIVGCAFYEFGLKGGDGRFRIDVKLASTTAFTTGFFFLTTVTDQPWDPLVDAPFSHENPNVTFIGEYFGLDASGDDFCVLWTDTRTGHQELWFARVATWRSAPKAPKIPPSVVGQLIGGVAVDGGGWVIVGGFPHPVPPWGPATEIMQLLAANALLSDVKGSAARRLQQGILRAIGEIASRAAEEMP